MGKKTLPQQICLWLLPLLFNFFLLSMAYGHSETLYFIERPSSLFELKNPEKIKYPTSFNPTLYALPLDSQHSSHAPSKDNTKQVNQRSRTDESSQHFTTKLRTANNRGGGKRQPDEDESFNQETYNKLISILSAIKNIMKENPRIKLILSLDVYKTLIYRKNKLSMCETMLFSLWQETVDELRSQDKLLLVYNSNRKPGSLTLDHWLDDLPEPDVFILGGGVQILFNTRFVTPLAVSSNTSLYPNIASIHDTWKDLNTINCMVHPVYNSLTIQCRPSLSSQASNIHISLIKIKKNTKNKYLFLYDHASDQKKNIIIFAGHQVANKGAALAWALNQISAYDTVFSNKIKLIISAGDSLPDTAMMHKNMHYPFDDHYSETELTPSLPQNTYYVGAVLSKGGELQNNRFDDLLKESPTVKAAIPA